MDTERTANSVHDVGGNLYASQGARPRPERVRPVASGRAAAVPLAGVRAMLSLKHDIVVVPRRDSA